MWGVDIGTAAGGGGGFDPTTVGTIFGWWKADALGLADSAAVSSWTDSSGNGRHFVQATGANQPVYKTGIVNSLPVVRFNGSASPNNSFLSLDGVTVPGQANPSSISIFVVAKSNATSSQAMLSTRNPGSTGWLHRVASGTTTLWSHTGGTNVTDTLANTGAWNILELVRTNLSAVVGHNGTMASPTVQSGYPATTADTDRIDMGSESQSTVNTPAQNPLNGDIAEVLIYSTALSDADRDSVEAMLGTKYAITVA